MVKNKIKKLERDTDHKDYVLEIVDKINEIIEHLNGKEKSRNKIVSKI